MPNQALAPGRLVEKRIIDSAPNSPKMAGVKIIPHSIESRVRQALARQKSVLTGTDQSAGQVQIAFNKSICDGMTPVPTYKLLVAPTCRAGIGWRRESDEGGSTLNHSETVRIRSHLRPERRRARALLRTTRVI